MTEDVLGGDGERQNGKTSAGSEPISYFVPSDTVGRGVIVTDAGNRVLYTDPRICELLGIEALDLMGKDILEVVNSTLKNKFSDPDEYERRAGELIDNPYETAEDVFELNDPANRVLHRYSTPLIISGGKPIGRIDVYSDITKRRQLEQLNADLYQRVSEAYEQLAAAQEQLVQAEKLRAVGEIASGVAHDFNNTLGIILGNVQLLLRTIDDPKIRSRFEAIEQAALDGAETVRRIREFTGLKSPADASALSLIDLGGLASKLLDAMRPRWDDHPIEIVIDAGTPAHIMGAPGEIRQVLANILLNAAESMPEGGAILISTGRAGSSAWVEVSDSGIGMTDDVRGRVFDPFFTTKGGGLGLGMSVAYGIVTRHGGTISVDGKPDNGTTVRIEFPAAHQGVSAVESSSGEPEAAAPVQIMVVDDEDMFAQVFTDMLSECGHAVCVARNGAEAIRQLKSNPVDLVFTDLGMPEMSGWQVAKAIKDMHPSTPVVLVTGRGVEIDEKGLKDSSVDMVISKPVKLEELAGIIARATGGSSNK